MQALLRWFRREGPFSPAEIIAAISGTSLEWELDTWVIQHLLSDKKHFEAQRGNLSFGLNVNSSTIENAAFQITWLLNDAGVTGEGLEIEILEVSSIKILLEPARYSVDARRWVPGCHWTTLVPGIH